MNSMVRKTEVCPFCENRVIFVRYADFIKHLEPCSRRDAQEKLLGEKRSKVNMKDLEEVGKIIALVKEFERTDEAFKDYMIMCPACLIHRNSVLPSSFMCPICDACGGKMILVREFVAEYTLDAESLPKSR